MMSSWQEDYKAAEDENTVVQQLQRLVAEYNLGFIDTSKNINPQLLVHIGNWKFDVRHGVLEHKPITGMIVCSEQKVEVVSKTGIFCLRTQVVTSSCNLHRLYCKSYSRDWRHLP